MRSTTVSGNSAGAVLAQGAASSSVVVYISDIITDCTVSGNSFWGVFMRPGLLNLFVTNSTISGNSANTGFPDGDSGGGIFDGAG